MLEQRSTVNHLSKKPTPVTIVVTGNAGSGKTSVCHRFDSLGVPVIMLDVLAREVVCPGSKALSQISRHFGKGVLSDDGSLNRAVLRRLILKDETARRDLEAMLHPEIIALMRRRIDEAGKNGAPIVIVEVPLLFELGMMSQFDLVLLITARSAACIDRLVVRDHVTATDADALLKAQMPDDRKREGVDFIIHNNGSMPDLIDAVDRFYQIVRQEVGGKR